MWDVKQSLNAGSDCSTWVLTTTKKESVIFEQMNHLTFKVRRLLSSTALTEKVVPVHNRGSVRAVRTLLPAGVRVRFTASVVPDELPAAIIRTRVFIVSYPVTLL